VLPPEQQKGHSHAANTISTIRPVEGNLTAERGEVLQARSDMMELIAVTRHAIAQSRILIAEADSVITWRYPSLEHRRKVKEIPKETLRKSNTKDIEVCRVGSG
jgi:hypothetical protein